MGLIDNILGSSLIVWIMLILFVIHIYLKKTGKTFPEFIKEIMEAIRGSGEEVIENE